MEIQQSTNVPSLSHIKFDMSLYDYMLGQLEVTLFSGNHQIDYGILKNGLSRGQKLELLFANAETNCDIQLAFAIRSILPRTWNDIDIQLGGQESFVIYFNNNKSVSMLRLRENLEHIYTNQILPLLSSSSFDPSSDMQSFVAFCLTKLIILSPTTPYQLALAIRGLPSLIDKYRPLGLVIIDSLNSFFLFDYDLGDLDPDRRSSITIDPKATTFEIKRKGIATKKRKSRTYNHSLFEICRDCLKKYWKEYKFPLIVTKVETNSGLFGEHKLKEDKENTEVEVGNLIIDLNIKKIDSDQIMVISDNKSDRKSVV